MAEDWTGLRRLDEDCACPKGSAFRAFKAIVAELHEGRDFRQLHGERDAQAITELQAAGEVYRSSTAPVVLAPDTAERVRAMLGGARRGSDRRPR